MERNGRAFYYAEDREDSQPPNPGGQEEYRAFRHLPDLGRGPGNHTSSSGTAHNRALPLLPRPPPQRTKAEIKGRYHQPLLIKPAPVKYEEFTYVERYNQGKNPGFHLPGIMPHPPEPHRPMPPPPRHNTRAVYRQKVKKPLINLDLGVDPSRAPVPSTSEVKIPANVAREQTAHYRVPPTPPPRAVSVAAYNRVTPPQLVPSPPISPPHVFGFGEELVMSPRHLMVHEDDKENESSVNAKNAKNGEHGANVGPAGRLRRVSLDKRKKRKVTRF